MTPKRNLSIIMPAYNEEASLEDAANKVLSALGAVTERYQLIIVNDGSNDNTGKVAGRLASRDEHISVFHHPQNRGFGSVIKTGVSGSKYELIMLCPVDNPLESEEIARFLEVIDKADVVVGYRSERVGYKWWMRFGSWVYHWIISKLFGLRLRDYNWIHLYRKEVFDNIEIAFSGIVCMPEVLVKVAQRGYRLVEISSEMKPRLHGKSTVSKPKVIVRTFLDLVRLWLMVRGPFAWRKENDHG